MSFNGLGEYNRRLNELMDSPAFKEANDKERMQMGYRLLNSPKGKGWVPLLFPIIGCIYLGIIAGFILLAMHGAH